MNVPLKITEKGVNKEVLVSIGSLSKRLLLTEKQIQKSAKEGTLEQLIEKRVAFLSRNKEILEDAQILKRIVHSISPRIAKPCVQPSQ